MGAGAANGPPPAGGGGGPATNPGARGALLLAVAVILGIVLLQKFDSGTIDTGGGVATVSSVPDQTTTTRRVGLTTLPVVTSTTLRARAKADVKVVVANGAGVRGLGASTTNTLKNVGYTTLAPTDTTTPSVDKTSIQFAEGYEADAREVAATLSLPATVVSKLNAPPVAATDTVDAKVIVVLGVDFPTAGAAGSTTSTLAGIAATTSTVRR
jgi:hypothetical protein